MHLLIQVKVRPWEARLIDCTLGNDVQCILRTASAIETEYLLALPKGGMLNITFDIIFDMFARDCMLLLVSGTFLTQNNLAKNCYKEQHLAMPLLPN